VSGQHHHRRIERRVATAHHHDPAVFVVPDLRVLVVDLLRLELVEHGQLAWELRQDPRVVPLERTNIRYLEFEKLGENVDLVVIDVSFISLRLVFPKALEFLKPGGYLLALVKPQFEAGADEVGKRGKVSDSAVHEKVMDTLKVAAEGQGFIVLGQTKSSIVGKKSGNEEFFLWLQKLQNSDSNKT